MSTEIGSDPFAEDTVVDDYSNINADDDSLSFKDDGADKNGEIIASTQVYADDHNTTITGTATSFTSTAVPTAVSTASDFAEDNATNSIGIGDAAGTASSRSRDATVIAVASVGACLGLVLVLAGAASFSRKKAKRTAVTAAQVNEMYLDDNDFHEFGSTLVAYV